MFLNPKFTSKTGYALMMVLVMTAVTSVMLAGAMSWAAQNTLTTARNNDHMRAVAAAEGATEKILSSFSRDYQNGGEGLVYSKLASYATNVPNSSENSYWTNFTFTDAASNNNRTYVSRVSPTNYVLLQSQYQGLMGMAATYRVISNAKNNQGQFGIVAGVGQEIQVAEIPLFQFAIFYSMDLEINPGPNMNVTGRVHSNAGLYAQPQATLNFQADVTAVGNIVLGKKPGDPTSRTAGTVSFADEHDSGVSSMNLPIGTNNSPDAVHAVLDMPPAGELATSLMGKQRFYNKADMVFIVSNTTVYAQTGNSVDSFATAIPKSDWSVFLNTNVSFFNKRENKTVKSVQIDVGKLKTWSTTNTVLRSKISRDVNNIYIADNRTQTSSTEPGIRLVNGQDLPGAGLTVATPDPIYVQGHYNAPAAALATTNTTATKPASLLGDSINILSTSWNDSNAGLAIGSRIAGNTTVNAAFLGGICVTTNSNYSGGVENFPRFLEDWGGKTLTYNGSMVVMFDSRVTTAPWGGSDVYSPPNRNWAFDLNFMDPTKLPPGTPQIFSLIRGRWATIKPNVTTF
ncbi:MAG: hypothetical protein JWN25_2294 [Verrucomicrobiales bacterium]|nr:hypothetical protein [Verrucomicrobiales bacterium]MDB6130908.1 hypothetical protein [Verrucomicrobiales bacterium]